MSQSNGDSNAYVLYSKIGMHEYVVNTVNG